MVSRRKSASRVKLGSHSLKTLKKVAKSLGLKRSGKKSTLAARIRSTKGHKSAIKKMSHKKSRKARRKSRKASRKSRKARRSRKASRKSRKASRKSRKARKSRK